MGKRRNVLDRFKAKVALEALRGDKTIPEIAARRQIHPNQVSLGKKQAVEGLADVYSRGQSLGISAAEVKDLHVAAVVGDQNRVVASESFATPGQGYRLMLEWMRSFGDLERVGIKATASLIV